MKRLKLSNIGLPDKQSVFTEKQFYSVNLGNGIRKKFKSKAEAVKFLNDVSKYLTYKMHEANELYISVFAYYRRAWFYFDHDKVTQAHNLAEWYRMERQCNDCIDNIKNSFDLLYKRTGSTNANYFVFSHFYNILDALALVVKNLFAIYENKSMAGVFYELEILTKKIQYCRRTIENYSIELENSFNDVETIDLKIIKTA